MAKQTTSSGKKGGLLVGPSHAKGGIKGVVSETQQPIEVEGGEIIINKAASKQHCETLSKINQSAGGGVPIPCDKQAISDYYSGGGQISTGDPDTNDMETEIKAIQTMLKYASDPIQINDFNSRLSVLSAPPPDAFALDDKIKQTNEKYIDPYIDVLNTADTEIQAKRDKLLNWIKTPENNVQVLIAFSGGKDSVAMVLRSIYEWNIPKSQIKLYHHEVDGQGEQLFDWPCTTSYCVAFANALGIDILFSYSDGGILKEMYRVDTYRQPMYIQAEMNGPFLKLLPRKQQRDINTKLMFPAVENDLNKRWCSSVAKIEVMSRCINNSPALADQDIVIMTGERRVESTNRAKYNEIERYDKLSDNSDRKVVTWRSVIDLSDEEVWKLFEEHKIQPHPCYELGWGRCSCQLCIFSNANIWATNNELSPDKVKRIADIEKDFVAKDSKLPYLYAKRATKRQIEGKKAYMKRVWEMLYPNNTKPKWVVDVKDAKISSWNKRGIDYQYYDIGSMSGSRDQGWQSGETNFNTQVLAKRAVNLINQIPADVTVNKSGMVANGIYVDKVYKGKSFLDPAAVKRWKKEALGEFTSPIFIDTWKMPKGSKDTNQCGAT